MPPTKPFNSLTEVRAEKERLRRERDRVQSGLKDQLELVRDKDFRKALIGDAVGDMLQAWRPVRAIMSFLGKSPGTTGQVLGSVLGGRMNSRWARVLMAVASAAIPVVMDRMGKDPGATGSKLAHELAVSWGRVKDYVRERRETHREQ
jgi:hypothetical protein